jgi:hypothetical protein
MMNLGQDTSIDTNKWNGGAGGIGHPTAKPALASSQESLNSSTSRPAY